MKTQQAAKYLEALGNATRLGIYRHLIKAGDGGAPVGEIQKELGIPGSTLSHHIGKLVKVGLIHQERQSRILLCKANYEVMHQIIGFLSDCCCANDPTYVASL